MRIGSGYDVHRLGKGRKLILGGVEIPYEKGLIGHSDADVLVHAIMDALLGAASLGDIGALFPDTDPAYAGIDSMKLLKEVYDRVTEAGFILENIDATVIAQAPKLRPYIDEMRTRIAGVLEADVSQIGIKATTEEHLGFTGRGEGIAAQAVCLLSSIREAVSYDMTAGGCARCPGAGSGGCAAYTPGS
ncbi:MAG: 2-C-methyl-D-erythritol 2,4-cyclodiphosphate synthase [Lachnospiraceae bacterium]|nr:2-C-methyl-D-erythritol 2,4-cyclodiphosphate synthase [Lachnospiraceae bacterium]